MRLDLALCLPRDAETVAIIRGVVTDALRPFGVTETCIEDIRLALSEACINVIEHATGDDEYEVRLQVDEETCEISVTNTGAVEFDAAALAGVMPDSGSARGRGVAIMRAVMDQVVFRSEPEVGTIVHLVKTLEVDPGTPLARLRGRSRSGPG